MALERELKKQISSITLIIKIIKSMKLTATAKLKKVGKRVLNSKLYFSEVYAIFNDIISNADDSIYKKKEKNKISLKTCWIIINSNFGLCGSYNNNINKMVLKQLRENDNIIIIGAKAKTFYINKGYKIIDIKKDININFSYDYVCEFVKKILFDFNNKKYDELKIAYTKFINNITFEPTILQLLPIVDIKYDEKPKRVNIITEFEPNPTIILKNFISIYLNTILFSTIIESQVSEQASRRAAMENSLNNANKMLEKLLLIYNHKRQASITQEIIEIIVGGSGI